MVIVKVIVRLGSLAIKVQDGNLVSYIVLSHVGDACSM